MEKSLKVKKHEIVEEIMFNPQKTYVDLEPAIEIKEKSFSEIATDLERLTLGEKFKIILATLGYDSQKLDFTSQIIILIRMLPLIENRTHLFDIGTAGSGKSFVHSRLCNDTLKIESTITEANLFFNVNKKNWGAIYSENKEKSTILFDELTTVTMTKQLFAMLRELMETGKVERVSEEALHVNTSLVFAFNLEGELEKLEKDYLELPNLNIFQNIERGFSETAFLDRMAGVIPSWFLTASDPFITSESIEGYNFGDFYNFIVHQKKEKEIKFKYTIDLDLNGRSKRNIKKVISGLIKFLFPLENYSKEQFDFLVSIANWIFNLMHHKNSSLCTTQSNKKIILDIMKPSLKSGEIKKAWINSDYLKIKYSDESHLVYEYPLHKFSAKKNKKAFEEYQKMDDLQKEMMVPFIRLDGTTLVKEYDEPLNNYEAINLEKSLTLTELSNLAKTPFEERIIEYLKDIKTHQNALEKKVDSFTEDTISTYRALKLELHGLTESIKDNKNLETYEKAPFLTSSSILSNIKLQSAKANFKALFNINYDEVLEKNLTYNLKDNRIKLINLLNDD